MNQGEYWEDRIARKVWKSYNTAEDRNRDLIEFYMNASKQIREELYSIAEKYSRGGVMTLSDMYKENRLKSLEKKYRDIAKELGEKVENTATQTMQEGYSEVYQATGEALGIGFSTPNKKLMEKALNEPWRGDEFSSRLWKNQRKLAGNLNDVLLRGIQQGKAVTDIAVDLHNSIGNSFNACHRLVRTETMHYLNDATLRRYQDAGVTQVQVWAAIDERTCDVCGIGGYHERVYPIEKAPSPPFHPNCRCTILPVLEEKRFEEFKSAIDRQEYKKIVKGKEEQFVTRRGAKILTQKVETYDGVYLSVNAHIKPKALHTIHQTTKEAVKRWGIPQERMPKIVIVGEKEMPTAYGMYNAADNTVYYVPEIANPKDKRVKGEVEFHEMWHAKQAERFRTQKGEITDKNYAEYIRFSNEKAKETLDKLGLTEYDIGKISSRTPDRFAEGRFDEIEAEYMTKYRRKGHGNSGIPKGN